MGHWEPSSDTFQQLINLDERLSNKSPLSVLPCSSSPKDDQPFRAGVRQAIRCQWKWDGIRGQVIRRQSQTFGRGELLMDKPGLRLKQ